MKQRNWVKCTTKLPEVEEDVLLCFCVQDEVVNMAVGFMAEDERSGNVWCVYVDAGFYTVCDTAPFYWKSLPNNPTREVNVWTK